MKHLVRFSLLLGAGLLLANCAPDRPGWGVRSVSFSGSTAGQPSIPGLDTRTTEFGTWGDSWVFCVWTDGTWSSTSASWDGSRKAAIYAGSFIGSGSPKKIPFECKSPDGINGTITIGTQQFDLARGALFLISTTGGETAVSQLGRDRSTITPGDESVHELASSDGEIRGFFTSRAPAP